MGVEVVGERGDLLGGLAADVYVFPAVDDGEDGGLLDIPDIDVGLESGDCQVFAVGTEGETHDVGVVVEDIRVAVLAEQVVHADGLVPTAAHQSVVRSAELQTVHWPFVSSDHFHQLALLQAKYVNVVRVRSAAAHQVSSQVQTQTHQLITVFTFHFAEHSHFLHVVSQHTSIQSATHQSITIITAEFQSTHSTLMLLKLSEAKPTTAIPNFHSI